MKEQLWSKKYLFSLLLVFGVNMGYALLNSVMTIYGVLLTDSNIIGGYLISVFTIAALIARLFIKKLNERFSNKQLLVAGLLITVIAATGYCLVKQIGLFLLCRALHGIGFGISLTCATAISNEYVPLSRLNEGVGFTASANTIANAIGPTLALEILGSNYDNFLALFIVLLIITTVSFVLSLLVKSNTLAAKQQAGKSSSFKGIIIAAIFFLAVFSQGAVNSFLAAYGQKLELGNIGLFFTIVALATLVSRFFSHKVLKILGMRKLSFILTIILALSVFSIAIIQSKLQLYLIAIPFGIATGILYPIYNFRIIQTVLPSQFAFAASIYYCSVDLGYGIGAIIWGYVVQYFNYQTIYFLAALVLIIMAFIDQFAFSKMGE